MPTPSCVATTALLGSRSQASTIFGRNVSATGNERDRVDRQKMRAFIARYQERRRPVRIGYLRRSRYPNRCNNYATKLHLQVAFHRSPARAPHVLRSRGRAGLCVGPKENGYDELQTHWSGRTFACTCGPAITAGGSAMERTASITSTLAEWIHRMPAQDFDHFSASLVQPIISGGEARMG